MYVYYVIGNKEVVPVSYTHLDVYKRQTSNLYTLIQRFSFFPMEIIIVLLVQLKRLLQMSLSNEDIMPYWQYVLRSTVTYVDGNVIK